MQFSGSGIPAELFQWFCDNIPADSSILEFGSGHASTKYMSRYWRMHSIEHNLEFVNLYPSDYIYAPITSGENPWYDMDIIQEAFERRNFWKGLAAILVDGPPGDIGRCGITKG